MTTARRVAPVLFLVFGTSAARGQFRPTNSKTAADSVAVRRMEAISILQGDDTLPFIAEGRIALVSRALKAIRAESPRLADITVSMDMTRLVLELADTIAPSIARYTGIRLPAQDDFSFWGGPVRLTGISRIDELNRKLGVQRAVFRGLGDNAALVLEFARAPNIDVLAKAYQGIPQVAVAWDGGFDVSYSSIGMFSKGRTLDFVFARGGGDCPAGCTEWDYYYVAYDTLTGSSVVERERSHDDTTAQAIHYWDFPTRYSVDSYPTVDSLLSGMRDPRWWYRVHAIDATARLLGDAVGPWRGSREREPSHFATLQAALRKRQQEGYQALIDRLADRDQTVRERALVGLRQLARKDYAAGRDGLVLWQQWLRELPRRPPPLEIRFLDVGQGDAILVRQGPLAALIDAGPPGDSIVRRLAELGVDSLQLLVATHAHADHIGSAPDVLSALRVSLLVDNGLPVSDPTAARLRATAERRGTPIEHAARRTLMFGDTRIEIIPPPIPVNGDTSQENHSVLVRIERKGFRALLTGDAATPELDAVLSHEAHIDVLKAPRHGDEHALTDKWLRQLSPRTIVISAGPNRVTGEAMQRFDSLNRDVRRTDFEGDVVVTVHEDGSYSVRTRTD